MLLLFFHSLLKGKRRQQKPNLVFYAQSTFTVISGRDNRRQVTKTSKFAQKTGIQNGGIQLVSLEQSRQKESRFYFQNTDPPNDHTNGSEFC